MNTIDITQPMPPNAVAAGHTPETWAAAAQRWNAFVGAERTRAPICCTRCDGAGVDVLGANCWECGGEGSL